MSTNVQTIANRLLGAAGNDFSVSMSPMPASLLETVAGTIMGAEQEMRSLNPRLFSIPREKRLAAEASLTVTIGSSAAKLTVASGIPNAGVTVLIDSATGGHNRILSFDSGTTWNLQRTHEGGNGTVTTVVWDDCWIVSDGDTWEVLLGEVRLDGRPLTRVNNETEAHRSYNVRNQSSANDALAPVAGKPQYYWTEWLQTSALVAPEQRLRLFPMPSAAGTLSVRVVERAPEITTAQLTAETPTRTVGVPGGKVEELFMPIVWWHWAMAPFWKPDAEQFRALQERYQAAVQKITYLSA